MNCWCKHCKHAAGSAQAAFHGVPTARSMRIWEVVDCEGTEAVLFLWIAVDCHRIAFSVSCCTLTLAAHWLGEGRAAGTGPRAYAPVAVSEQMVVVHPDGTQPAVPLPALSEDFGSGCALAQERDEKLWLEVGMPISRLCVHCHSHNLLSWPNHCVHLPSCNLQHTPQLVHH
jgi:hypothetical protein